MALKNSSEVEKDAIRAIRLRQSDWANSINANRIEKVVEMYTDDCIVIPPGETIINGKDAMRNLWQPYINAGVSFSFPEHISFIISECGTMANDITIFSTKQDGVFFQEGVFNHVWKKIGDIWYIQRHQWNITRKRRT
ncbi:unnamed protein product [Owenia fusiformis]|uniref:DUF4440 domain-containing protein n=1 Tax=Owenia fusiformis TaxID=6347 RepID=A0A8J1UL77_OWEFU|nr:unnamed protein product [Owenia fusiformis]